LICNSVPDFYAKRGERFVKRIFLIGYGNPGRLDDGLGPALAAEVAKKKIKNLTVEVDYQLNVEDAQDIAEHDIVIFADASCRGGEPFFFEKIQPKAEISFTSHSVEPQAVLAMAHDLFNAKAEGYVFGIRGYDFNDFGEKLSIQAKANLKDAIPFIVNKISEFMGTLRG